MPARFSETLSSQRRTAQARCDCTERACTQNQGFRQPRSCDRDGQHRGPALGHREEEAGSTSRSCCLTCSGLTENLCKGQTSTVTTETTVRSTVVIRVKPKFTAPRTTDICSKTQTWDCLGHWLLY